MRPIHFLSALALGVTVLAQSVPDIEGVVLENGTNRAMANVQVSLTPESPSRVLYGATTYRAPTALKTVVTDKDGRFIATGLPPGRYRLSTALEGFVFLRPDRLKASRDIGVWVQVGAGQTVRGVELKMVREGTISGRVLDVTGQPIPGNAASVTLQRYTYDENGNRRLAWVPGISYPNAAGSFLRMNDRGEYRFYGLPPGEYFLTVSGSDFAMTTGRIRKTTYYPGVTDEARAEPIRVDAGQEIRLNTLVPIETSGPAVRLRFTNPPSEPGGISIHIGQGALFGSRNAFGGPDKFELAGVAPGHYEALIVTSNSFVKTSFDVGTTSIDQEITLNPGARVQIRRFVEDAAGQRFPGSFGCSLRTESGSPFLCGAELDGSMYVRGTLPSFSLDRKPPPTIAHGAYQFDLGDVPNNAYVVSATAGGRDILRDGLKIDGNTEIEIVMTSPGSFITGTVSDSMGNKLSDAVVALVPDATRRNFSHFYRSGISDVNGSFELRGVGPGNYHLFAWSDLEGAAYRNADFMKPFEDRGTPVRVEKGASLSINLTALEQQ